MSEATASCGLKAAISASAGDSVSRSVKRAEDRRGAKGSTRLLPIIFSDHLQDGGSIIIEAQTIGIMH